MRSLYAFLALSLPSAAFASTSNNVVPTSVKINNSQVNNVSCEIVHDGYTYKVNDLSGKFGATCLGASLARAKSQAITLSYSVVAGQRWADGIAWSSNVASSVDWFSTNAATGTTAADQCLIYNGGYYAVDRGLPEEDITCAAFIALQYNTARSWIATTVPGAYGSEITSITVQ